MAGWVVVYLHAGLVWLRDEYVGMWVWVSVCACMHTALPSPSPKTHTLTYTWQRWKTFFLTHTPTYTWHGEEDPND